MRALAGTDVVAAKQRDRRPTRTIGHLVTVLRSRALGCECESSLGRRQTAARCAAVCLLPRSDSQQVWDEFGSEGGTPQTRQSGVPLRSGARDVTTWSLVATT